MSSSSLLATARVVLILLLGYWFKRDQDVYSLVYVVNLEINVNTACILRLSDACMTRSPSCETLSRQNCPSCKGNVRCKIFLMDILKLLSLLTYQTGSSFVMTVLVECVEEIILKLPEQILKHCWVCWRNSSKTAWANIKTDTGNEKVKFLHSVASSQKLSVCLQHHHRLTAKWRTSQLTTHTHKRPQPT